MPFSVQQQLLHFLMLNLFIEKGGRLEKESQEEKIWVEFLRWQKSGKAGSLMSRNNGDEK